MSSQNINSLPYNPNELSRELKRHYISASEVDITQMLRELSLNNLDGLFSHIPEDIKFNSENFKTPHELSYESLQNRLSEIADKNNICESYIGDGLPDYSVNEIVPFVSDIRTLTTAYTPYQPERSQGTLMSHWIYQCMMSSLTGFEAINSSLYDRATAIFEAICTSIRIKRKTDTVIVSNALYPGDIEVLNTLASDTQIKIIYSAFDSKNGCIDFEKLKTCAENIGDKLAAIIFPQVNALGLLEDVDRLTNLCSDLKVKSVAVIDPMHLSKGGLKPPTEFGENGADILVGEGQHLAIGPNFGGPGLGVFGVRINQKNKNDIRSTPGRFVGKAKDINDRDCHVMVLSTREQHIRKEKATSNICSNQAFLATLAGASILARGEDGMAKICQQAQTNAQEGATKLTSIDNINLVYPDRQFFNEILIELPKSIPELIQSGSKLKIHIGADMSNRIPNKKGNYLKLSFTDKAVDIDRLINFFKTELNSDQNSEKSTIPKISNSQKRSGSVGLPNIPLEEIKSYYKKLGELNATPDDACYPLGSCTMKYNPYINDWAAALPGFTDIHPQAPLDDIQGSLEVLYEIEEWFKKITGLAAVTTQPVAGAQGELLGLKLFQKYHSSNDDNNRDVILIPKSAHGTNFATATMAGFNNDPNNKDGGGIVYLEANEKSQIDLDDLDKKIAHYGKRICGCMITNPNTCGIFETKFKQIAEKIHAVGGLVFMDGANMNAIAGWVNIGAMGVDAIHNNLHKTWTIPHGGGGPGDAIVAVSEKLVEFLPGYQIKNENGYFKPVKPSKSIGSFHRHWGNFAHKVRCLTYLLRLGNEGIRQMTALAVLSSNYLYSKLKSTYPALPTGTDNEPRMHEFILTLTDEDFELLSSINLTKPLAIQRLGKLFLDFGYHAPTVAWPEALGLMIEPTESYDKKELDRFAKAVIKMLELIREKPEIMIKTPMFTPVDRTDDVAANRNLVLHEKIISLPTINQNREDPVNLINQSPEEIAEKIKAVCNK